MSGLKNKHAILWLLTLVYAFNFIDRQILAILAPFVQADLDLTNTQLGLLLGFAFALFYSLMGIPIAFIADRVNRVGLLAIALAAWSSMTAVTGMAQNFVQIGLARIGVGVGEAGGTPASQAIISDLFPKEERSAALGVYAMGIPFGLMAAYFISAALMGSDPDQANWRRVFLVLGISGVVLAGIVLLLIREPERGATDVSKSGKITRIPFKTALPLLLRIPTWWFMALGCAAAATGSFGLGAFQTKYLRLLDPEFSFRTIVIVLGIYYGTVSALGTYLGAKAVDVWAKKDVRAYGWVPMLALVAIFPLALASYWAPSVTLHLVFAGFMLLFLNAFTGPCYAIAQTLAPIHIRALSTALFFLTLNLVSQGGGPTIAGILMDMFGANHSELVATRYALTAICGAFFVALFFFFMVTVTIRRDWQDAETRNEG